MPNFLSRMMTTAFAVFLMVTACLSAPFLPTASAELAAVLPSVTLSPTPPVYNLPTPAATASLTYFVPPMFASPIVLAPVAGTPTPLPSATSTLNSLTYTVVISGAFARREPNLGATQFIPLMRGQSYPVLARSPDGLWVQVGNCPLQKPAWIPAAFGLLQGDGASVPVVGATQTPLAKTPTPTPVYTQTLPSAPYLPVVSAHARAIYRYGLMLGNNPRAFIKIGDCQATTPYFLAAFDSTKSYHLGDTYAYLQETVRQFSGSFGRVSVAANTGFGTATVLDPQWANPNQCKVGESPLSCETRVMRPSLALISLGTNDVWLAEGRYEGDLRQIVEYLIRLGVVPIISTKADDMEGDGRFNKLVVRLAAEYDIPLWDFWQVTRPLPDNGIQDHLYHLSWGPAIFDDPKNMQLGWPWRNLTALQSLDTVWRGVR